LLKKLLYEPLVHFLILGALLFFFYSFSQNNESSENSIVISEERIKQLTKDWEKKFFTTITLEEKQKMIDKEVYEEVLYKEALKLGLDKNDNDIRGHLAKKMEFLSYDRDEFPTPDDKTLKIFMLEHQKKYREEEKIHFMQRMMGTDTMQFEKEYTLTLFEASNIFGRSFSEALFTFGVDGKKHKIESEYGVHEVLIVERSIPKLKAFVYVKEQLQDDYTRLERERQNRAIYETLKVQYSIKIEEK